MMTSQKERIIALQKMIEDLSKEFKEAGEPEEERYLVSLNMAILGRKLIELDPDNDLAPAMRELITVFEKAAKEG